MMPSTTFWIYVTSRMFPLCLLWDVEPWAGLVLNWSLLALWEYLITVEQRQVYFEADMTNDLYNYYCSFKSEKSATLNDISGTNGIHVYRTTLWTNRKYVSLVAIHKNMVNTWARCVLQNSILLLTALISNQCCHSLYNHVFLFCRRISTAWWSWQNRPDRPTRRWWGW